MVVIAKRANAGGRGRAGLGAPDVRRKSSKPCCQQRHAPQSPQFRAGTCSIVAGTGMCRNRILTGRNYCRALMPLSCDSARILWPLACKWTQVKLQLLAGSRRATGHHTILIILSI